MQEFLPQIDRAIEMAKGRDLDGKQEIYRTVAMHMVRAGLPDHVWQQFSEGMLEVARHAWGWDENPPVWLHAGPHGLEVGEMLKSWPYAPSKRKTAAENRRAVMGLIKPSKPPYVFFTPFRNLAERYLARHPGGAIYQVQPESEIRIEPDALAHAVIWGRDPEINWPQDKLLLFALSQNPAFCARSARIVGVHEAGGPCKAADLQKRTAPGTCIFTENNFKRGYPPPWSLRRQFPRPRHRHVTFGFLARSRRESAKPCYR